MCRRFHGKQKTISAPGQRLDEPRRLGRVAQNLADLPDAEVQSLLEIDEGVITPDALADVGAREHLTAVPRQQLQNPERLRRQLDPVAVSPELARTGVQLEYV